jgi:1-pyrroline-5-carboxylate dehydrogenase
MGGKNAILVDETADLNAAAAGVINSAFGYSGQKCSACSRLIAVDAIHDRLVEAVADAARKIKVGAVKERASWMGPVVSQGAYQTILNYIEIGKGEGRVAAGRGPLEPNQPGWYIQPTVIVEVDPSARIAQEEIFGPVLATLRVRSFEEGLAVANNTDYGLTGAVYSRDRARLEMARSEFHAGNLYFNRKCTGALVDVQPFGGFNMSGTDSKAGGRDYLLLFMQAKAVSEKL